MYRDDPLDDETELRTVIGDDAVDDLADAGALDVALDTLRLLQGWTTPDDVGRWFASSQRRLDGRTPVVALTDGDHDDVLDAARAYAAALG